MLLVRHNRLLPPFHDYAALAVHDLDQLAAGAVSPSIAALPDVLPWPQDIQDKMRAASFFVASPSLRAQQTAQAVMAALKIEKPLSIDDQLQEIQFVPSLLRQAEHENPLQAVRDRLYPAILDGRAGAEPLEKLEQRMAGIAKTYTASGGVLFTHGFLIRLYLSYRAHLNNMKNAIGGVSTHPSVDYLQVFEV